VLAAKDVLRLNKKAILSPSAKSFISSYGDLLKEDKQ
jgi:ethanolamine utilization cobalamin adenosyltransferase